MKKKKWMRILMTGIIAIMPATMLTGCKSEEKNKVSQAYYVISEELDVNKTMEKAQEILQNAETSTQLNN